MKTKTPKKAPPLKFIQLPRDFRTLCLEVYLPRPIHNKKEYAAAERVALAFAGWEEKMTADQNDYFVAVTDYMLAFENIPRTEITGVELLKHLMEDHRLSGAAVSRILGSDRAMANKILKGTRVINADYALALGKHFGLNPGAFLPR